jgi:hypothetical protein
MRLAGEPETAPSGDCILCRLGENASNETASNQWRNAGAGGVIQSCGKNIVDEEAGSNKGDPMNISRQTGRNSSFPIPEEQSLGEREEEARKIRRLQLMISMVSSVISQDPSLTVEEASELAAGAKRAALAMFPDKELAYDLLYKPRLQRLIRERFRLQ